MFIKSVLALVTVAAFETLSSLSGINKNVNRKRKRPYEDYNDGDLDQEDSYVTEMITDVDGYVHAYTDGSVTTRASFAAWFGPMSSLNFCDVIEDVHPHPVPDINVAELTGICKALEIAYENGIQKIKIHTDSKTSIKLINLISVNRAKGIRSKTYSKCPEIIESILRLSEK